jgi:hypothetical protein
MVADVCLWHASVTPTAVPPRFGSWGHTIQSGRGNAGTGVRPDRTPLRSGREPLEATSPPPQSSWAIYNAAAKAVWLGEVEATDERTAIEKGAEHFKVPATKLIGNAAPVPRG